MAFFVFVVLASIPGIGGGLGRDVTYICTVLLRGSFNVRYLIPCHRVFGKSSLTCTTAGTSEVIKT